MSNLRTQLVEAARNSRVANTEKLCEALRKIALEEALQGYTHLSYRVDKPVEWSGIKAYFQAQGISVETDPAYYTVTLRWD